MIELIFVIVIIGILAAVAIPKLAATRSDAQVSAIIANARTFKGDLASFFTAQGQAVWDNNATNTSASAVPVKDAACTADANTTLPQGTYSFCEGSNQCLVVTTTPGGGFQAANGSNTTSQVCIGVQGDPTIVKMIAEGSVSFGSLGVIRN